MSETQLFFILWTDTRNQILNSGYNYISQNNNHKKHIKII